MSIRTSRLAVVLVLLLIGGEKLVSAQNSEFVRQWASREKELEFEQAQALGNIALAEKLLAEASVVGSVADQKKATAKATLDAAVAQGTAAKDKIKSEFERMRSIETEIIAAQDKESEYVKALKAYEAASDEFQKLRKTITKSPEYQIRYARAMANTNSKEQRRLLDELHFQLFKSNRQYSESQGSLEAARLKLAAIRMQLLSANSDWVEASKTVREARLSEADAKKLLTSAGLNKMAANRQAKEAADTAQLMNQIITSNAKELGAPPPPGVPVTPPPSE